MVVGGKRHAPVAYSQETVSVPTVQEVESASRQVRVGT